MPKKTKKGFKPHVMYHPKTGKTSRANTYDQHIALGKRGYVHSSPKKKTSRARDSFPDAVEKRLKGGY
tara:strand:- start:257 stop:460 length:204 start_codon:yes stop_codon:yes gene_type:complete